MNQVCVLIPVYKKELDFEEECSVYNTIEKMYGTTIYLVGPHRICKEYYRRFRLPWKTFPDRYFESVDGYNQLLINENFYKKFANYEYLLIAQTDAWILKNSATLKEIMAKDYDYWGAAWYSDWRIRRFEFGNRENFLRKFILMSEPAGIGKSKRVFVGNGGLSLRNVSKTIALLKEKRVYVRLWGINEDAFFAYHGMKNRCGFRIAPVEETIEFAVEQRAKKLIQMGHCPFGVHAWKKWYPELLNDVQREI